MHYFLARARTALRQPHRVPGFLWSRFKAAFLWDYYFSRLPDPKREAIDDEDARAHEEVVRGLRQSGFDLHDINIDASDFDDYLRRADYPRYSHYYAGGSAPLFREKALEHYLAASLLDLSPDDLLIDIAAGISPAADIYHRLYGCQSFSQDLAYEAGIQGRRIGGDATSLPLPDDFASRMALHCSFEHFEGDADIRFLQEARRVLRSGGRVCILPLYLSTEYQNLTDPVVLPKGDLPFEPGAVVVGVRGYFNRFGRVYDVVGENLGGLALKLYQVLNAAEIDPACYLRLAAVMEKR
jgi:SAM-dependent methyltransferase